MWEMDNYTGKRSRKTRVEKNKKSRTLRMILKEWLIPIIIAFILAFIVNRYIIFKIEVPTGSMIPTINVDDRLFVKRVYNKDKLERGNILVFNSNEDDILLVKRLIGLPGEKISLIEGDLFVNDVLMEEPYVINQMDYKKINSKDYTSQFIVPENHLLFFGDNRETSRDARFWEDPFIHVDDVIGKAGLRIYPFKDIGFIK